VGVGVGVGVGVEMGVEMEKRAGSQLDGGKQEDGGGEIREGKGAIVGEAIAEVTAKPMLDGLNRQQSHTILTLLGRYRLHR
jgi:hypothetical protein